MPNLEIDGLDNVDLAESTVKIETGLDNVDVKYDSSALIDVDPYEYYLTSSGIYTGRLEGDVPSWLADYVSLQLTTNAAIDSNAVINTLQGRLDTAETGITQNLQTIQTVDTSLSALETAVVSRLNDAEAGILELDTTRVTADEALAIATNLQISTFGNDAEAFVSNILTTYASSNLASVTDYNTLVSTLNGVSASVSTVSEALVTEYENPDWVDDGFGTDPDINLEPRWITSARAKHSLEVNADGNIAGFVAETDGSLATFDILADKFTVANGTTKLPVFTVDTINQLVSFTSDVSIDGSLIVEDTLQADRLKAGTNGTTVWTGGGLISNNFNGNPYGDIGTPTAGFRLSSDAVGTSADPNVYGAYIRGSTIDGTTIKASEISFGGVKFLAEDSTTHWGKTGYTVGNSLSAGDINSTGDSVVLGTIVMPKYGSGLDNRRALSVNSNIYVNARGYVDVEYGSVNTVYIDIQRSISGGAYTTVATELVSVYKYNGISYGGYYVDASYNATFAGISTTGYVSFRARIRVDSDVGHFSTVAGTIVLQN